MDPASSADEGVDEAAFMAATPELPFALGDDFLEDIQKFLVEEEDMDPDDKVTLQASVMQMAAEMCHAAMSEDDEALDSEIFSELESAAEPFVDASSWERDARGGVDETQSDPANESAAGVSSSSDTGTAVRDVAGVWLGLQSPCC
jgi:hypothetical protein